MRDILLKKEHELAVQMFDKIQEENLDCEVVIVGLIWRYKGSFHDDEPSQRKNETADNFSYRYNLWHQYYKERKSNFNKWIKMLSKLDWKY